MAQPFIPGPVPVWVGFGKQASASPPAEEPAPAAFFVGSSGGSGGLANLAQGAVSSILAARLTAITGLSERANSDVREGLKELMFLGFTVAGVDVDVNPEYSPITTDAGGGPTDLIYRGATATVSIDLARWREDTYAALCDHAARSMALRGMGRRGRCQAGRVGTVMGLEGAGVALYLPFPYAAKFLYNSMPAGYRFPLAILDRERLPSRGARPARLHLIFRCLRALQPERTTSAVFPKDDEDLYVLYDHDMSVLIGRLPD